MGSSEVAGSAGNTWLHAATTTRPHSPPFHHLSRPVFTAHPTVLFLHNTTTHSWICVGKWRMFWWPCEAVGVTILTFMSPCCLAHPDLPRKDLPPPPPSPAPTPTLWPTIYLDEFLNSFLIYIYREKT